MKITIKSIEFNHSNKDNQPYLDRNSRAQCRVVITTEEHGNTKLSAFAYQDSPVMGWRVGDSREVEIQTKGKFTNFTPVLPPRQPQAGATFQQQPPTNAPARAEGLTAEDRRKLDAIYDAVAKAEPKEELPY